MRRGIWPTCHCGCLAQDRAETGSLVCLGCGHEHNCGIHGCALLREAAERIDTRQSAYFVHDGSRIAHGVDCWHYIAPLIPVSSEGIALDIYVMVFQALFEAEERRKKDG